MYIDPFVAGVISTILVELVLIVGYAMYVSTKKKKGGQKQWQESL